MALSTNFDDSQKRSPLLKASENQIPQTTGCLLTPPGKGGIGVVALQGPKTHQVLERLFKPLSSKARGNLRYGHILWEGRIIDEVLLYCPPGEGYAEIHCHGGKALVEEILQILGLSQVEPEVFLDRKINQGKMDILQKEALLALPRCLSTEGLFMVLNQLRGTLRGQIEGVLSLLEGGKDHEAKRDLKRLLKTYPFGEALLKPAQVLILGAPNVGKSSLLNLLLEKDKALVTSIPGTTRDMVSDLALVEGIPFDFSDSAGIRSTNDLVEKMGIEKALAKIDQADFLIGVFEAPSPPDEESWKIVKGHRGKTLVVLNKIDLGRHSFWQEEDYDLVLSCLTREGLEDFKRILFKKRLPFSFDGPVLFTERQHRLAQKALAHLPQSREILLELMG